MARVSLLPLLPLLLAGLAPSIGAATPQAYFLLTYDMLAAPSWPTSAAHASSVPERSMRTTYAAYCCSAASPRMNGG